MYAWCQQHDVQVCVCIERAVIPVLAQYVVKGRQILRENVEVVVVKWPVCQGSLIDSDHMLRPRLQKLDSSEVGQPVLQLSAQPVLCVDGRYASGVGTQVHKRPVEDEEVFEKAHAMVWMLSSFKWRTVVTGLQALKLRWQLVLGRQSTCTTLNQACE